MTKVIKKIIFKERIIQSKTEMWGRGILILGEYEPMDERPEIPILAEDMNGMTRKQQNTKTVGE